ncbi:TetR/AcrR family transcriptional regulator [Paenactinomyces guangxiensis]|uniref:TetR/AcrR family transcriptional regulator n=1 Tax=Paenactinomyces guangxiensis TaxID=1490290 RepID=A0A7W2A9J3_9BACL|nr:TetR/AcrR family transcriptional regulator [Paenactinomyces guangxiensis]MBA4495785.1 TetR/AcrR family transcriptional regulator [Paenactinomyces guangxiensis]MBH8592875.1 TetR/AcrR family transcriptional regulator [Paenactinomyces guangxiensis]
MSTANDIKTAAIKLFSQYGYKQTTISKIAEEVGIKAPTIYSHYKNKEDLFLQIFEEVIFEHVHHIKKVAEKTKNMNVEQRLFQILCEAALYYTHDEKKIHFLKHTMIFPPQELKEEIKKKFYESEEMFSNLLRSLFSEGIQQQKIRNIPIEHLLTSFYCLLDGLFTQMLYGSRTNMESKLHNVWGIYWAGIRAQGTHK